MHNFFVFADDHSSVFFFGFFGEPSLAGSGARRSGREWRHLEKPGQTRGRNVEGIATALPELYKPGDAGDPMGVLAAERREERRKRRPWMKPRSREAAGGELGIIAKKERLFPR